MGCSRQEYWSGLPFPFPGDLPDPRDRTRVSRIVGRRFTIWATREPPTHTHTRTHTSHPHTAHRTPTHAAPTHTTDTPHTLPTLHPHTYHTHHTQPHPHHIGIIQHKYEDKMALRRRTWLHRWELESCHRVRENGEVTWTRTWHLEIHQLESLFHFPKHNQRCGQGFWVDVFQYSSNLCETYAEGSVL